MQLCTSDVNVPTFAVSVPIHLGTIQKIIILNDKTFFGLSPCPHVPHEFEYQWP